MRKLLIIIPLILLTLYLLIVVVVVSGIKSNHTKYQKEIALLKSLEYSSLLKAYLDERYMICKSMSVAIEASQYVLDSEEVVNVLLTNILVSEMDIKSVWYISTYKEGRISEDNRLRVQYKDKGNKIKSINTQANINEFSKEILSRYVVANKEYITNPFYNQYPLSESDNELICRIAVPVLLKGIQIGMFGIDVKLDVMNKLTQNTDFKGNGYFYILSDDDTFVAHEDNFLIGSRESEIFKRYTEQFETVKKMRQGIGFSFILRAKELSKVKQNANYNAVCSYVPVSFRESKQVWYAVVVIPLESSIQIMNDFLWFPSLLIIISLLSIILITNNIIKKNALHLVNIKNAISELSKGKIVNVEKMVNVQHSEIKHIVEELKEMAATMNNIVQFSRNISKGNYEHIFTLKDTDDIVGKALIELGNSLKNAKTAEEIRIEEDEKRNWQTRGLAEFGEIIRKYSSDFELLTNQMLSNIIQYLNANQGGIFTLNKVEKQNPYLELVASYAYNSRKYIQKKILMGEGLVGTCAVEMKTIYLKEIPDSYIEITSGLGEANPNVLLLVPMIIDNEVLGVLEIASFNDFLPHEIEFMEKIAISFSSTLMSVRNSEETNYLLETSRLQAEEVKASEEEMRQNMEELLATQDELQRKNDEHEEMQNELKQEQQLFDKLLKNIPALIYFKDTSGRYLKVSKSLAEMLGVEFAESMIGTTDNEYFISDVANKIYSDELEVMQTGIPKLNVPEELMMNNGQTIFARTSRLPLFDINRQITGIMGMSLITTEIEELKRQLARSFEKLELYENQ